ncbi:hypothetical protein Lesp02_41780 [Lentzea sp. NBRC 105346]|nr:hypothetical protein Lesp02_41780 [Lentzea sp. NBRC 105346]
MVAGWWFGRWGVRGSAVDRLGATGRAGGVRWSPAGARIQVCSGVNVAFRDNYVPIRHVRCDLHPFRSRGSPAMRDMHRGAPA